MLNKSAQVEWPQNGDIVDLAAPTYFETLQQRTEIPAEQSTDTPKRRSKLVRFQTTVAAHLESQKLVLEFPEDVDTKHLLGGVDSFRMDVAKGDRLKVKLREVRDHEGEDE